MTDDPEFCQKAAGLSAALNVLASAAYEGEAGSIIGVLLAAAWITGRHCVPKDPALRPVDSFLSFAASIAGEDVEVEPAPVMKAIRYFTSALREVGIDIERLEGFKLNDRAFEVLAETLEKESGAMPGSLRTAKTLEIGGLLFQRPIVPEATVPGSSRVN